MNASLLFRLALRNLAAHKVKSGIVGSLMFFGTFLVVVGGALLSSVERSMQSSITSSVSGHLQVYSKDAKDELSFFPSGASGTQDVGEIDDVTKVAETLRAVPGVKDVVPMGLTQAIVFGGTELDRALDGLRAALDSGDAADVATYSDHVRSIVQNMREEADLRVGLSNDPEKVKTEIADLDRALSDEFWGGLAADREGTLQFLEGRVAPQAADGRLLYLRCLGVDIQQYQKSFSSFKLVEGEMIPPGEQGILLSKRFYERQVKTLVARELDAVERELADGKTIASDELVKAKADRIKKLYRKVLYELSPADAKEVEAGLAAAGFVGPISEQMVALLTLDDTNFRKNYDTFYGVVAPRIRLYETPVGSEIVLRGFTKSGYMRAVPVKVYGTFEFSGLETSDLAGANQLVDLDTFRQLYGRMSSAQQAELAEIRASVGIADLERSKAEDELFGGAAPSGSAEAEAALFGEAPAPTTSAEAEAALFGEAPAAPAGDAPGAPAGEAAPAEAAPPSAAAPTPASGGDDSLALNAAIILEDPAAIAEMTPAITAAAEGLGLQTTSWEKAAGIVGQLIMVLRGVLVVALTVILVVALVIINNTMVMTTMERIQEIGTMRAIGAPKVWVILLFMAETLMLGAIAGTLGLVVGVATVLGLHQVGIPAPADIVVLLFAGPRLYPDVGLVNMIFAMVSITLVSLLSTLYPAALAAGVSPVVAMSPKE